MFEGGCIPVSFIDKEMRSENGRILGRELGVWTVCIKDNRVGFWGTGMSGLETCAAGV